MTRKPVTLPDLDDEDADFRRKLSPLVDSALPDERRPGITERRKFGVTNVQRPGIPGERTAGSTEELSNASPVVRINGRVGAAEEQAKIEELRGAKRRFEYLIPERVGRALAEDAASQGKSATTKLLEVLRDAGYPVIQEDLVDLRKMPKR